MGVQTREQSRDSETLLGAVRGLISQSEAVARAEVRATVSRLRDVAQASAKRAAILSAAALLAAWAVGFLLFGAFLLVATRMAPWTAAACVAGGALLFAAGLGWLGLRETAEFSDEVSLISPSRDDIQRTA